MTGYFNCFLAHSWSFRSILDLGMHQSEGPDRSLAEAVLLTYAGNSLFDGFENVNLTTLSVKWLGQPGLWGRDQIRLAAPRKPL